MKELKPIEESWNKKRIFIGLIILFILISALVAFKVLALDKNQNRSENPVKKNTVSVKGESVNENLSNKDKSSVPTSNLKTNIQDQLEIIKKEASGINLAEVATSSPQVQKVIDDIKALQNLPKNQAKSVCEQICNGL